MEIIGNLKIEKSKLYVDVTDSRSRNTMMTEAELSTEATKEILTKLQKYLDSKPTTDETEEDQKKILLRQFDAVKKKIQFD